MLSLSGSGPGCRAAGADHDSENRDLKSRRHSGGATALVTLTTRWDVVTVTALRYAEIIRAASASVPVTVFPARAAAVRRFHWQVEQ
jgi:hypothetical protein